MKSKGRRMLLIAWCIVLNNCGHVKVFDKEVCGDLGEFGAHCAHTLISQTRDIPKDQWDQVRVGYLCMDSTGYNDTETTIDQLCRTTKLCDYRTRKSLEAAIARIRRVAERAAKAQDEYRHKVLTETGVDLNSL